MDIKFVKQRSPGAISILDRLELVDCEDPKMDGQYTVGDIEPNNGDITLVGMGRKSGVVTVISAVESDEAAAA